MLLSTQPCMLQTLPPARAHCWRLLTLLPTTTSRSRFIFVFIGGIHSCWSRKLYLIRNVSSLWFHHSREHEMSSTFATGNIISTSKLWQVKETKRQTESSTPQISAITELRIWSSRNNFMCRCSQKSPRRETLPWFLLLSNDSLNSPRCPAPGTHLGTCFCHSAPLQGVSV